MLRHTPSPVAAGGPRARPAARRIASAAALACAAVCAASCADSRPRPNVLLVWIDTVRVDHMSLYGYGEPTTPSLDALAERSVVFDQAITHVPQTLPSTASLFTARPPASHGVRVNGIHGLPEDAVTLAEVLAGHGYDTAGIASAFPLHPRQGIAQGFDLYDADFADTLLEQSAEDATEKAIAWLDGRASDAPFFLFVHYFDPHFPYDPPEAAGMKGYDGEIAWADAWIGRLVADVEARDGETLVVVGGDHGELLTPPRAGYSRHAGYLQEPVLRVPLLVHAPGRLAPGRVDEQVAVSDIAPTILELVGVPAPSTFQGESLVPLARGDARGPRLVAVETLFWKLEEELEIERYGVRSKALKYQLDIRPSEASEDGEERMESLYDLERDPTGDTNLVRDGSVPEAYAGRLAEMRALVDAYRALGTASLEVELDEDTAAKLRGLGYLGSDEE